MSDVDWQAAATPWFAGAQRALSVGVRAAQLRATELTDLASFPSLELSFDAILWQPQGAPGPGLDLLKRGLAPGGALLLLVDGGGAGALLRALFARRRAAVLTLEAACEALLQRGFVQPQLVLENKRGFLLAARQPDVPGKLDELFAQPVP